MDFFDGPYFQINKFFLFVIGQWPYLSLKRKRCIQFLITFSLFSCLFPSVTGLISVWGNVDQMIECLPPIFTALGCIIYTFAYICKEEKLKILLERIKSDWKIWSFGDENAILSSHAEHGRNYTILYAGCVTGTTITYAAMTLTPQFLNIILPINETRQKKLPFPLDYFVDSNEYFYWIEFHIFITATVEMCVLIGSESIFAVFTEHACGLFRIIGYRLKSVKNIYNCKTRSKKDVEEATYKIITFCIEQHNRAIEFCDTIESCFSICFFFTMGLNSIIISATLLQVVVNMDKLNDAVKFATFSIALIIHLYFNSLPAQRLMDHSIFLADLMYDGFWYQLPLKPKKLLSMIIMRTSAPCTLTAGNICVMSLKTFCTILQTSFSYFTLLSSVVVNLNKIDIAVRFGAFTGASIAHLFLNSLPAQRLMDYSANLADNLYDSSWYQMPVKIRKLLLLIMMRSRVPCKLTAGKMLDLSLRSVCSRERGRGDMTTDLFDNRYFYINKFFLSSIGQWPYHTTRRNLFIQSFIFIISIIYLIATVSGILKIWGSGDKMMECLPPIFTAVGCLIYSAIFLFNQNKLNQLFNKIKCDWELWSSDWEQLIISNHANHGRIYTIFYTGCIFMTLITYLLMSITPQILDIVFPLNESRPKTLPTQMYYFTDYSEKYYYWIIIHIGFTATLQMCVLIGSESILAIFTEHACALFKIIGLQLKKINSFESDENNLKIVIFCIEQHNRAIEFCNIIESLFSPCFFFIMGLNTILISASLIQVVTNFDKLDIAVKFGVYTGASIAHLLLNSLPAQRLIDYSANITYDLYDGPWYQMPAKIRKMLLLIMMRSRIPCKITAGKMFVLSLKNNCSVAGFFRAWGNSDKMISCTPVMITGTGSLLFMLIISLNQKKFGQLYREIKFDWEFWSTEQELLIISNCANHGKLFTLFDTACVIGTEIVDITWILSPKILDIILPVNESRSKELPYEPYYFVNYSENYFYLITFHISLNEILISIIVICVGSTLVTLTEQGCALFKIIGLQLEKINNNENEKKNLENLFFCIEHHNRAIEICRTIESIYGPCFLFIVACNASLISVCLTQLVVHLNDFKSIKFLFFGGSSLLHLFFISFFTQRLMDYSTSLMDVIYSSAWYQMPMKIRKNLLFIMMRSGKTSKITAGKIMDMSMASACSLVVHLDNFQVALKFTLFGGSSMIHLFFISFFSQRLIDYSTGLTDVIYDSCWYEMPVKIRKILLLIMMRSRVPCKITAGKMLDMSLKSACSIGELYHEIKFDWEFWSSEQEQLIILNHANHGKLFTFFCTDMMVRGIKCQ
ncbi:uncharacterized protein LOC127289208 [Leptopilina boulardi]|uniref:uncharacterized protein LOC127289208 n=1 Tax=Leptopilina boulardi TaxID=63433 RepID=UPI0021F5A039|nr:uncharacterized protein LOC127289208 [Leptopilina boulardi]